MEDVLASIRRILSEEGQQQAPTVPGPVPAEKPDGVLMLDPAMMVPEEGADRPAEAPSQSPAEPPAEAASGLVAPEAAAAAATAIGSLRRTLTTDRSLKPALKTRPGGATIEDIVREELRLLLKDWLDAHLAEMVERLVRAEIERVVGRSVP